MRHGIDTAVSDGSATNKKEVLTGNISNNSNNNNALSSNNGGKPQSCVTTKQDLQKQLKLRNEVLQQLDKAHTHDYTSSVTAAAAASQSAKNRCGKCTSEFSMLKAKCTCMNW